MQAGSEAAIATTWLLRDPSLEAGRAVCRIHHQQSREPLRLRRTTQSHLGDLDQDPSRVQPEEDHNRYHDQDHQNHETTKMDMEPEAEVAPDHAAQVAMAEGRIEKEATAAVQVVADGLRAPRS